jgi:hypothetical protein
MLMALAAGCPEDDADGGAGNGGDNMCADTGVMNGLTQACASCGCDKCPAQVASCQDAACQSVLACGIRTGCTGTDCYCGIGVAVTACLQQPAMGPCMNEIVAASGVVIGSTGCATADACAVALSGLRTMPANALYRSNAVSECTKGAPAVTDAMGMVTTPAIVGMCAVECM